MDPDHIVDMFAPFGPVVVRRMFGGFGIYADGMMFGLAHGGVIYLKADRQNTPAYETEAQAPFTYAAKGGKRVALSYWRLPDRLYDDSEELARWAREALAAARRAAKPARSAAKPARKA
ncbi:MAG TPA: TfoX/Sxy family protein [Xanthobacteraceae bacterium]